MGLYNISYSDKETEKLINHEMGKPYSLIKKIQLKGIGSRRMIIEHFSENMKHLALKVSGIQYANIELRPKGVIIHINQGIYTYAWTVPFFRLSIYNGNFFTIHGNGNFIQFDKQKSWKENRTFLQKIMRLKSTYNSTS